MISEFGWPDPNTGFDQSEHALYTCYFISLITKSEEITLPKFQFSKFPGANPLGPLYTEYCFKTHNNNNLPWDNRPSRCFFINIF